MLLQSNGLSCRSDSQHVTLRIILDGALHLINRFVPVLLMQSKRAASLQPNAQTYATRA